MDEQTISDGKIFFFQIRVRPTPAWMEGPVTQSSAAHVITPVIRFTAAVYSIPMTPTRPMWVMCVTKVYNFIHK